MALFRLRYRSDNLELSFGEFLIGRSSRCNLALADALVSRRHAALHVSPEKVVVADLGSRNGVVVNGVRIDGPTELEHMYRLFIGAQELLLIHIDQITDRLGGERYVVCNSCGAISGATKRHCGDLRCTLGSTDGLDRTRLARPGIERSRMGRRYRPVGTLEVIGGTAAKAITMGRFDEAERVLLPHLDGLLERGMQQLPLADSDQEDVDSLFQGATTYALKIGPGSSRDQVD